MALPLTAGTYVLDPTHTQIGFVVTHLGITPIRGIFAGFEGALQVGETERDSRLEVTVALASLQSSHPGREAHVQNEDFFDTERHPAMSFRSTAIEGAGERWNLEGGLTLRGITRPVTLDVTMTGRAVFPLDQQEHIGFVASGTVSRTAFGVAPKIPAFLLSDDIALELSVQLIAAG